MHCWRCTQRRPTEPCCGHQPPARVPGGIKLPQEPSAALQRGFPSQTPDRTRAATSAARLLGARHQPHPIQLWLRRQRQNICREDPFDPVCSSKGKLSILHTGETDRVRLLVPRVDGRAGALMHTRRASRRKKKEGWHATENVQGVDLCGTIQLCLSGAWSDAEVGSLWHVYTLLTLPSAQARDFRARPW